MSPSDLRAELPYLLLGTIVFAAGAATLAFSVLKLKDRSLLYLGWFAGLYGARMLIVNPILRNAFDISPDVSDWCAAVVTYTILIPGALFFRVLIGDAWRNTAGLVLGIAAGFAPIAITWAVIARKPWAPDRVQNVVVITITLLAAGLVVYRFRRRGRLWLVICFLAFMATVIARNLQISSVRYGLEPFGFFVLLIALGSVAAGRVIDRERRLQSVEHELKTARQIQFSILPRRAPSVPGLVVAARYEPMTEVAGDFYDFLVMDERRLTILVADVSGHGVPAALIASMLKVALGSQNEYAADPAEVLSRINAALRGTIDGHFVTAACAHIDLAEGALYYAGAGHPPSLLWKSARGELPELDENGLILGPFPGATYSSVKYPLETGDCVLFYTDGLVEGTSVDGQPFGMERLKSFVRANEYQDPPIILDRLLQSALAGAREDDVTLVLVKVVAS